MKKFVEVVGAVAVTVGALAFWPVAIEVWDWAFDVKAKRIYAVEPLPTCEQLQRQLEWVHDGDRHWTLERLNQAVDDAHERGRCMVVDQWH